MKPVDVTMWMVENKARRNGLGLKGNQVESAEVEQEMLQSFFILRGGGYAMHASSYQGGSLIGSENHHLMSYMLLANNFTKEEHVGKYTSDPSNPVRRKVSPDGVVTYVGTRLDRNGKPFRYR